MVVVPPLLAGLIRHGVGSRVADVTVTELADLDHTAARLRDTGADLVIVGPAAPATDAALIRRILPHARVLTVSADLARLVDLDTGEGVAFTPDALVDACGGRSGSAI
jgi:hypothetical protein